MSKRGSDMCNWISSRERQKKKTYLAEVISKAIIIVDNNYWVSGFWWCGIDRHFRGLSRNGQRYFTESTSEVEAIDFGK